MTRRKDYHKYIDSYMDKVRSGEILASSDLIKAMDLIENRLDDPDVEIRSDMIEKADELITRYFYKFFDWELFVLALVHCYYKSTDTVVFDEFASDGNGQR